MFEKEIKFITDYSLEKIKSLGSYFTFEDILSVNIHPSITKYISAELSYLIFEDRGKLLSSSIFDYSQPNVVKILKSINNELKKFKAISFEDIKQLTLQAVSFNANFIVRPKWSLLKLVFNESESKESEEVLLILDYIYYHEYLRNIIAEYIIKKKLKEISRAKFEEIISNIDTAIIKNNYKSYINNTIATILDFYSIGNKNKININTDYVEIFLKEKELLDPLLRFKKTYTFGTGINANTEEIKKILFEENNLVESRETEVNIEPEKNIAEIEKTEIREKDELVNEQEYNDQKTLDDTNPEADETEKIEEEKFVELNKAIEEKVIPKKDIFKIDNDDELLTLFDEELKALAEDNELSTETDFISKEGISTLDENIESSIIDNEEELIADNNFVEGIPEETISEEEIENITETKPLRNKDIFQYLTDKEIEKIVSNVFNEDQEDFATTIERVSECNTLEEAKEIIKGLFISYRVNMYTKDASTLTTAITNYFNQ
ncbi:MAG: hypothetical protein CO128_05615 [Ignavibacteriales bacterium CG_4_9_14_3_um_filter_30_11]|nr:MAG: hypothetical protein CO128_05615 [Ignavibacteriales bacterium CG_4_9_14_3_um_filter_30_11]